MLTPGDQAKTVLAVFLWISGLVEIFYLNQTLTDVRIGALVLFMAVAFLSASNLTKAVAALAVVASIGYYLSFGDLDPITDALKFAVVFAIFLPALLLTRETIEASPELSVARSGFLQLTQANRATGLLVGSQLLASVLTLGVLAITSPLVERGSSETLRRETLLTVLRGIMLGGLWTPFSVAVIWILNTRPKLSLIEILGPGFLFALAGTLLAVVLFSGIRGLGQIPSALRVFKPLIPSLATAILVVLVFAHFLPFSTIETVAIVLPVLCLMRLFSIGPRAATGAVKGLFSRIGSSGNELLLFGSAVVLGFLLNASGISSMLVSRLSLDTMPFGARWHFSGGAARIPGCKNSRHHRRTDSALRLDVGRHDQLWVDISGPWHASVRGERGAHDPEQQHPVSDALLSIVRGGARAVVQRERWIRDLVLLVTAA